MSYIDKYRVSKQKKLGTISDAFNKLSFEWQKGNARQYLESLEPELQYCIICHLMDDYINDKSNAK
jgi:hypothetical protein